MGGGEQRQGAILTARTKGTRLKNGGDNVGGVGAELWRRQHLSETQGWKEGKKH